METTIDLETFGGRVTAAREHARLTPSGLAAAVGSSEKTVYNWEGNANQPGAKFLQSISEALGVSASWLLTGEGAPSWLGGETGAPSQPRDKSVTTSREEGVHSAPPSLSARGVAPQASDRSVTDTPANEDAQRTRIAHLLAANDIGEHVLTRAIVVPTVTSSLASTGDGILSDRIDIEARVRAPAAEVRTLRMPTDALEPTVAAGTPLDVVPTSEYRGAGVYLFALDGRDEVGRLSALPGGALRISFDNPVYPSFTLIPGETGGYVDAESGLVTVLLIRARANGRYHPM